MKNHSIHTKKIGVGNTVDIPLIFTNLENLTININGDYNHIILGDCTDLVNVNIFIEGSRNKIVIGKRVSFARGGNLWIEGNDCTLEIGSETSFEDVHLAVTENNSKIIIGNDCMFAYDIDIRTGDSHSIIDVTSNVRTNPASDVIIGDHVWLASHCSILKGVKILDNCIVATRSVVTKSPNESGVIVGGSPAKVIKRNINWDRKKL